MHLFRKNKKGIELSMSFLVLLILSIVVLGFGVYFAYKIFGFGTQNVNGMENQAKDAADRLALSGGNKVGIPEMTIDVQAGKPAVFGISILNIMPTSREFRVSVDPGIGVDENNVQICGVGMNHLCDDINANFINVPLLPTDLTSGVTVQTNKRATSTFLIGTKKEATRGTYSFDVTVRDAASSLTDPPYDHKKIYVTVT